MLSKMLSSVVYNRRSNEDCDGISSRRDIVCSCCDVIGHRLCDCKSSLINNLENEIINIIKIGDTKVVGVLLNSLWMNNKSGVVFALCYSKQIMINDTSYKTFKLVCKLLLNYYYIIYYIQPRANRSVCPVLLRNKSMYIFKTVSNRIIREHNTVNNPIRSNPILIPIC